MDGTRTANDPPVEESWAARPVAAFALRAAVVLAPIAVGTLTAQLVSRSFDADRSIWLVGAVSLVAAGVVSLMTARVALRALPLAALLRMTMLFPDQAPSRMKIARKSNSKEELGRRLSDPDPDVRRTAETLLALVTALGRHDRKTRGHSERVRVYCDLIGTQLGLSEGDRGRLRWAGLLHDIGKLDVKESVLNKAGKLDDTEWVAVRAHPDNGARIAGPLEEWLGPWFGGIAQHHERFDGAGYPLALAGEHITMSGRIVSVVDAFETMTAARSYKSPMSTAVARAELTRCAGSHFDPIVVRAFLAISLPRLLWTMGLITFLVNVPFLRWIPTASARASEVASAGVGSAAGAVQLTAVTLAVVAAPAAALAQTHSPSSNAHHALHQRVDRHGGHSISASSRHSASPVSASSHPGARSSRAASAHPTPTSSRSASAADVTPRSPSAKPALATPSATPSPRDLSTTPVTGAASAAPSQPPATSSASATSPPSAGTSSSGHGKSSSSPGHGKSSSPSEGTSSSSDHGKSSSSPGHGKSSSSPGHGKSSSSPGHGRSSSAPGHGKSSSPGKGKSSSPSAGTSSSSGHGKSGG